MKKNTTEKNSLHFEKLISRFFDKNPFYIEKTSDNNEPDFLCSGKCYIECTLARKGKNSENSLQTEDSNDEHVMKAITEMSKRGVDDFALSRLSNSIGEKAKQLKKHIAVGKINAGLPRIVCLSVDLTEFGKDYNYEDIWADTIKRLLYQIDGDKIKITTFGAYTVADTSPAIKNTASYGQIKTGWFLNKEYSVISAILFVKPRLLRKVYDYITEASNIVSITELISDDFALYINSHAEQKLTYDLWEHFDEIGISTFGYVESNFKKFVKQ